MRELLVFNGLITVQIRTVPILLENVKIHTLGSPVTDGGVALKSSCLCLFDRGKGSSQIQLGGKTLSHPK